MFRVVTYNIRSGLGDDGVRSVRRIGEVLASLSPDIVCLQEVDQHVPRSWLANQPKFLSAKLGMQAVFQKNLSLGGGGYGNATLVKSSVQQCRCHRLPGKDEPRGVMQVGAKLDGAELTIFCTHLSTDRDSRVNQAEQVCDIVHSVHGPKILCGDFNDVPGSATVAALLREPVLRDCALEVDGGDQPTFKDRRIDYVLADLRFDVGSCEVIDTNASDHKPVVVDLECA